MEPALWKEIKNAYSAALELSPDSRSAHLSNLKLEVRTEVERLLAADQDAGQFIEKPFLFEQGSAMAADTALTDGTAIDDYLLIEKLGSGGMGTVYLAEHAGEGFSQRVALKLIKRGMDTDVILRRFLMERQILAALDHPNIARMLDGGSTTDGLPYFVMEYVEGKPIRSYCDSQRMDTRSRVALFAKVCDAVSYAHQKLVVHRDLKPSNILVTPKGEPKLLDFGIAKLLTPDWNTSAETVTATQFRILTPEYSSPEQLRGSPTTTLTDVYSLGVVLYELLTGVRPFQNESRSPSELAEAIETKDPQKPSVAALFSEPSGGRDTKATAQDRVHPTGEGEPLAATRRSVPDPQALRGDIDNIVLKALRREPERRYSSVQEMIEDIGRYLDGLPVKATGDTLAYRVGKFVKRHTAGFTAAAVASLLLIATASIAVWQAVRAERERASAESRYNDVRALANSLIFDVHDSIRELPGSTPARKAIVARALEYLDRLAAEGGNDMTLQAELAAGYERIGDVQGNPLGPNLGETAAAIESYKKALAIRESLFTESTTEARYSTAMLNSKLFRMMQFGGNIADAQAYCERATEILDGVAVADPNNSLYRATAARFHQELGDLVWTRSAEEAPKALEHYRQAISLIESIPASPDNEVAGPDGLNLNEKLLSVTQMAYRRIGEREEAEGRLPEALQAFRKALEECEKLLAAGNPKKLQAEVVLAIALGNVGRLESATGNIEGGMAKVNRAIEICERAVTSDPKNYLAKSQVALLYWNSGNIRLIQNELVSSLADFKKAQSMQQGLLDANPKDLYNLGNLADTYASIGSAQEKRGDDAEARESYQKSYEIWQGMKDKDLLAGYYSHKPETLLASVERVSKSGN